MDILWRRRPVGGGGQISGHDPPLEARSSWRHCDTSCTSGFVDDVIFEHNRSVGGRYNERTDAVACIERAVHEATQD